MQTNISGDLESAVILYTYISVCPSLFIQHCSNIKQEIVPHSGWKLYTIYKSQAISLDERLLFLFNDAIFLHLHFSNQVDNNEITNCNVCILNYSMYVLCVRVHVCMCVCFIYKNSF